MNGLKPIREVVAKNLAMYARGLDFVPKNVRKEDVYQVFLLPQLERFSSPCQVYYYQTAHPRFKKFGIAKDAVKRAKTSKRKANYVEALSIYDCETRSMALAIERVISSRFSKDWCKQDREELEGAKVWSIELSQASKEDFDNLFHKLSDDYSLLGSNQFIRKHLPDLARKFEKTVEGLLSGDLIVHCLRQEKINEYNDGYLRFMAKSDYEEYWDSISEERDILVTLEEAPQIFEERYGFKLIPDSAWESPVFPAAPQRRWSLLRFLKKLFDSVLAWLWSLT